MQHSSLLLFQHRRYTHPYIAVRITLNSAITAFYTIYHMAYSSTSTSTLTPYRPMQIAIRIIAQCHRSISLLQGDHVANRVCPCHRGISLPLSWNTVTHYHGVIITGMGYLATIRACRCHRVMIMVMVVCRCHKVIITGRRCFVAHAASKTNTAASHFKDSNLLKPVSVAFNSPCLGTLHRCRHFIAARRACGCGWCTRTSCCCGRNHAVATQFLGPFAHFFFFFFEVCASMEPKAMRRPRSRPFRRFGTPTEQLGIGPHSTTTKTIRD